MNPEQVRLILEAVRSGTLSIEEALGRFKWLPYEELGTPPPDPLPETETGSRHGHTFARLDTHRRLRTGYPEIVFCQGKTPEQVEAIVERLLADNERVLATRAAPEHAAAIRRRVPDAVYHEVARIVEATKAALGSGLPDLGEGSSTTRPRAQSAEPEPGPEGRYILVISAGTADIPVAEEAAVTAAALGSRVERLYDVGVAGLHRLLHQKEKLDGANVIICVAGMEGALPSVVGGLVEQPVIAVPTSVGYGASFQGLAALLTMLNSCATGVAVVNIDNGFGAGYFAHVVNSRTSAISHQSSAVSRTRSDPADG
jgi:NCAIR mutase (PurE)-related protein